MPITNVHGLLVTTMTYVLDFEHQIAKAAPTMAEASHSPELKELFEKTATKSKHYAEQIETVFQAIGETVKTNDNKIATAMVHEVQGMVKETEKGPVRDAALIVTANQQQAFRVASYGSMEAYAKVAGKTEALKPLREALKDSKAGDEQFNKIAEGSVNPAAAKAA